MGCRNLGTINPRGPGTDAQTQPRRLCWEPNGDRLRTSYCSPDFSSAPSADRTLSRPPFAADFSDHAASNIEWQVYSGILCIFASMCLSDSAWTHDTARFLSAHQAHAHNANHDAGEDLLRLLRCTSTQAPPFIVGVVIHM
ncbi:hypothetical protein PV11_02520 [Exophiala sideris]|uniref:Uncharacterized protein n=1 Tax=Exophiala sideris TaxID=1016849 RepID=A0A0D1YZI4_9EURO|nr:hypothetical protein PV11_02520 [Exophiala sideris]